MNKVKRCSALFLLVSQPIQAQGGTQYFRTAGFHSGWVLGYLRLDSVETRCVILLGSGFAPLLSMNEGPRSLAVAKSLGPKVLRVASYKKEKGRIGAGPLSFAGMTWLERLSTAWDPGINKPL